MKQTVLFIVICLVYSIGAFGQTGEAIYSISGNTIVTKSTFIDTFFVDHSEILTPYVHKKTETIIPSSAYGVFSLRLSTFNGYEDEAGMCNVIEILRDGMRILQLTNSNGFESISSYVKTEKGDYTLVSLSTNTYALIFNEWIYASQPSMVSIILIRNGEVKLVYNKPMFINSLTKQAGSLSMTLQSNTSEYLDYDKDPKPVDPPELHTLWWDGSVLRFWSNDTNQ